MLLSPAVKKMIDDRVRRDLPEHHASRVIAENRRIAKYEIQRFTHRRRGSWISLNDLVWHTVKVVECDLDDAIAHKKEEAEKLGIHSCHLRIVSET